MYYLEQECPNVVETVARLYFRPKFIFERSCEDEKCFRRKYTSQYASFEYTSQYASFEYTSQYASFEYTSQYASFEYTLCLLFECRVFPALEQLKITPEQFLSSFEIISEAFSEM